VPKAAERPFDRYEWIAFVVLFPAMLGIVGVVFAFGGRGEAIFIVGTVLAGIASVTRRSLAARLRRRFANRPAKPA
jgi:hypothetical protein